MELYQVRYFLALCDTLNFARAAERCNVSQPSLTRAVQKLEHELGGLLVRRERRLTLTELGHLVRPRLAEVLSHATGTVAAAKQHLERSKSALRLGVLPSIGPVRFAPLLARFSAEHHDVELMVLEGALPRLNELLLDGTLDAAVMSYIERVDRRLRYFKIYHERIVVVAPRGHRFEQCEVVRLRELAGENLLFRTNCDMGDFLLQSCRERGFEPKIIYRSGREGWVQAMVASGCGVTVMPEFTRTHPATAARPIADPDLVRHLSLVTVAGRRQEPVVTALIRAMRSEAWRTLRS